jgi:hypothetical protein
MRLLLFSLIGAAMVLGTVEAQSPGGSGVQISFGQTYKDFQFPLYQNGQISAMLFAVSAKGITVNRAETTNLKIELYTEGKVTTTITSPDADLYIADRVMRTKNTVKIVRTDMDATAQSCDFDLISKKYLLRQDVRVILKNFDAGAVPKRATAPAAAAAAPTPAPAENIMPLNPNAPQNPDALLDMPGAYSSTNAVPAPAHP